MTVRQEEEDNDKIRRMCEEIAENDGKPGDDDTGTCELDNAKVHTVSEAIRRNSGEGIVRGMIVSISLPFKVITKISNICNNCNDLGDQKRPFPPLITLENSTLAKCSNCNKSVYTKPVEYTDAKIIQLQDSDANEELELLDVFVYGRNTIDIGAGEIVRIGGRFNIQPNIGVRNKRLFTVLHTYSTEDSDAIIYEQRQTFTITNKDIESFQRFAKFLNVIDRLVSMAAPNVIGHKDKKLGILRSVVGGVEQSRRGRINTLFVGEIGTAKSTLARQATKILPKSRYVTAYNASAKSLLTIIEKDAETTMLRLGAVPLSKNAICSIDELQSMIYEEQGFLLNIMEEGFFTLDKYARHKEIDSPTTIIATANPYNIQWDNTFRISKNEIQIAKPLLDRFDQLYAFYDSMSEEEAQEYAENKTKIELRRPHNYNYLTKYLLYARKIHPLFTPEARDMINRFWTKLKMDGHATNRSLESIYRMAEATAKLHLMKVIDENVATEIMESVKLMQLQYGNIIQTVTDPRDVAFEGIVNIVRNTTIPITFQEAVTILCKENTQVRSYLIGGNNRTLAIENNKRFRDLRERFLEVAGVPGSRIMITSNKPLALAWLPATTTPESLKYEDDTTDLNDLSDLKKYTNKTVQSPKTESVFKPQQEESRSVGSVGSVAAQIHGRTDIALDSGLRQGIYKLYERGDYYGCRECNMKGDKFFMNAHTCRGIKDR